MKYKFFVAVAQPRKGHTIKKEGVAPLIWDKKIKALVFEYNQGCGYDTDITEELLDNEEWEVMKEQHDFMWAAKEMKEGRKVRRTTWGKGYIYSSQDIIFNVSGFQTYLGTVDFFAEDWEAAD